MANQSGRVLIFGAYGNGNLGDIIQAESLARAIKAVDDTIHVTAASFLSSSDFPFEYGDKAKRSDLMNPNFVNSFDLLIIGGGGLLAHPHDPLHHDKWVEAVTIPIAIWGVGATDFFAPQAKKLIQKAIFVSGRDRPSVETLLQYKDNVVHIIDPVLADTHLSQPYREQAYNRRAWIIAGPHQPIHDEIRSWVERDDIFIGFEPSQDSKIENLFPDIRYVNSTEEFFTAIQGCRVLSMRYHGTILAILGNHPVISLARPKSKDLLDIAGLGDLGVHHMDRIPGAWASQDTLRTRRTIAWHRSMAHTHMKHLLTRQLSQAKPVEDIIDTKTR